MKSQRCFVKDESYTSHILTKKFFPIIMAINFMNPINQMDSQRYLVSVRVAGVGMRPKSWMHLIVLPKDYKTRPNFLLIFPLVWSKKVVTS